MDGFGHLLRVGGTQNEDDVLGRLFERFQQRVERRRREHVNLVDDVNLVLAARGGKLHAADNLLAHILDARAAGGIELVDIGVHAVSYHAAILARAVRACRGAMLAQKRLGDKARRGGFASAARPAQKIGMAYFILRDGILQRALDGSAPPHPRKSAGDICDKGLLP